MKNNLNQKIFDLSNRKGAELYKKSADMDKIEININRYQQIEAFMKNIPGKVPAMPILKEGVFVLKNGTESGMVIFNSDIEDDTITVKADTLAVTDNSAVWLCSAKYIFPCEMAIGNALKIEDYIDPKSQIIGRKKEDDDTKKKLSSLFMSALGVTLWLNYLMLHPKQKEVHRKKNNPHNLGHNFYSNKEHIIRLNGVSIKTDSPTIASKIRSRKIVRVAECWSVRGHYRHYKSGKVVYIKPFEKGANKGKIVPKKYDIV